MTRSTKAGKARHLNAAYRLLERKIELPQAAQSLSREFGLSRRQAYRYLEEAAQLDHPVEVIEATAAITLKLPTSAMRMLRSYAGRSGLTLGEIVARALAEFFRARRKHG